ncbi:MAG: phosphoglycerate dehydrogenase [Synergistetes bacterium]|nr:phosphoglycerate dehydrogenase [Synergistota bacterium]MDW8192855.1 phosphoglycerate dehydrogenase [Synergistota bacterium]
MRRVVVAARTFGRYSQEPIEFLKRHGFEIVRCEEKELPSALKDADALIVGTPKVTREMLSSSRVRIIAKHGVGVDNIDLKAATELGIPVTVTQGANSESVAELTIAFIFALARGLIKCHLNLFQKKEWSGVVGVEVRGKTLGLLGFGAIAKEVNKRALCLGMRTITYDPYISEEEVARMGAKMVSFEDLLKESDFLSLHVPLTDETRGIIGEREIRSMKRSAFLINTARGGIVDENALAKALKEGWISGAALDVFEEEPPSPESPLFSCENLITTPHVGAHSIEAVYRMNMMSAQSVVDFFNGRPLQYVVNKEVLK